jgi:hypothetical protein
MAQKRGKEVTERILLGFEVGTGEPVYMRLHHLAIFGLTQLSGYVFTSEHPKFTCPRCDSGNIRKVCKFLEAEK